MSQFTLLKKRRFGPFFVTQFLGAFNDNVFKNSLLILIAFQVGISSGLSTNTLINLSAGLFILPFFLFSATAGQLADKYEKATLMRRIKLMEIFIMLLAGTAFVFDKPGFLILLLFLMGTQSAFFGPVKYAILPQHLAEEELVGGNGMVEMGTFLAILLGTLLGGVLISYNGSATRTGEPAGWPVENPGSVMVAIVIVAVAVAGWLASRRIPKAAPMDPTLRINWNMATETWRIIQTTRRHRAVFQSVLGISWFWFFGAFFLAQLPNYTKDVLGGDPQVVTLLLATFSLGIGVGSLLCERMSGRLVEIGLVPFGAIGLSLFALDLFFASPSSVGPEPLGVGEFLRQGQNWRVLADLSLLALFGGFYIVPLYTVIQHRSEPSYRSRVIAGNNILNALFMVFSAGLAIVLLGAGFTIPELFLVLAAMNAAVAVYIFRLVPEFLMRFIVWLLIHTVYKLEVKNIEHIPEKGPALLVCNHVSFVDALVIMAACRRPIRFVMYHKIFSTPILRFVFRTSGAIPIASRREDPEMMERAFDQIADALDSGHLIGLFPEGAITNDGEMNTFRPGVERIVRRTPVPVVPLALRGLWGSFFSRKGGSAMSKPRRLLSRFWSRIALVAGPPVAPTDVSAQGLHDSVLALRAEAR